MQYEEQYDSHSIHISISICILYLCTYIQYTMYVSVVFKAWQKMVFLGYFIES